MRDRHHSFRVHHKVKSTRHHHQVIITLTFLSITMSMCAEYDVFVYNHGSKLAETQILNQLNSDHHTRAVEHYSSYGFSDPWCDPSADLPNLAVLDYTVGGVLCPICFADFMFPVTVGVEMGPKYEQTAIRCGGRSSASDWSRGCGFTLVTPTPTSEILESMVNHLHNHFRECESGLSLRLGLWKRQLTMSCDICRTRHFLNRDFAPLAEEPSKSSVQSTTADDAFEQMVTEE